MKRSMLRALALLLLAAMLTGSMAGAESEPVVDRLLSDFFDYMYAEEVILGDALWAISYFEAYDEARDWESLLKARAAAAIARQDIAARLLPERILTAADLKALLRQGIDAGFMDTVESSYEGDRTLLQNGLLNVMAALEYNVFGSYSWNTGVKYVQALKATVEHSLTYCARTADWLLAEIGDDAQSAHFGGYLVEYCPAIAARRLPDGTDQAEIEADANRLMDEMEASLERYSGIVGEHSAQLKLMENAVESGDIGDITDVVGEVLPIEGLPTLLPQPVWDITMGAAINYFYSQPDGDVSLIAAPDMLDRAPDGYIIRLPEARESVEDYQSVLETRCGITPLNVRDEDGGLQISYAILDASLVLDWQDGTLTLYMLEKPACFAPEWYIDALR